MTDRELLEMAAKAAGISGYRYSDSFCCMAHWNESDGGWFDACGLWDPLTDDGDALRLAVKLKMQVSVTTESCRAETLPVLGVRVNDKDELAATRRAIVMAAANAWNDKP